MIFREDALNTKDLIEVVRQKADNITDSFRSYIIEECLNRIHEKRRSTEAVALLNMLYEEQRVYCQSIKYSPQILDDIIGLMYDLKLSYVKSNNSLIIYE